MSRGTLRTLAAQETLFRACNLQTVSFLSVQWARAAYCQNKVPKRRDIKDLRDKAGEMRGAVAGLCLRKIKALQSGGMMDGWESFIHQGLFTSPLNRPSLPLPAPPFKGASHWFDLRLHTGSNHCRDGSHGGAFMWVTRETYGAIRQSSYPLVKVFRSCWICVFSLCYGAAVATRHLPRNVSPHIVHPSSTAQSRKHVNLTAHCLFGWNEA